MAVKSRWKVIKESRFRDGKGDRSKEGRACNIPHHQLGLECGGGGKEVVLGRVSRDTELPLVFSFRLKHSGDFHPGIF